MHVPRSRPRPGILAVIGSLSIVWSIMSPVCVGLAFFFYAFSITGTGSGLTVLVEGTMFIWFVASPILSLVLFVAGWTMLNDNPNTLKLHRYWAWISLAIDALILGVLGVGMMPAHVLMPFGIAFIDLIYAIMVLNAAGPPGVRAFFGEAPSEKPGKPESWDDGFA